MNPGYVYTINIDGTPLIKIGLTINPANRIRQLSARTRNKLTLLALIATDDMREVEWALHESYHGQRLPQSEWFWFRRDLCGEHDLLSSHWITGHCEIVCYYPGTYELLNDLRDKGDQSLLDYGLPRFKRDQAMSELTRLIKQKYEDTHDGLVCIKMSDLIKASDEAECIMNGSS